MRSRASNDWFTKHDKNEIDELDSLDFHAPSGPQSVGVVPKLHNTSAGIEIYQLPPTSSKETFEKTEGPYRSGITKKYSNKRSGKKIAKFKVGTMAESGLACFYVSRLLGHLVEVPPATYRTMDVQEFEKVGEQARTTGHPSCTEAWANLRAMVKSGNHESGASGWKACLWITGGESARARTAVLKIIGPSVQLGGTAFTESCPQSRLWRIL